MEDLKNFNLKNKRLSIGHLPSSYMISLSYEEQLLITGQKIDEIITFINSVLEREINEYINEKFNEIMIDTMYEEETETLVLYLNKGD